MDVQERQQRHLRAVTEWAKRIRMTLGAITDRERGRVHFRPGSKGAAMVGLLPERPQRGKSGLTNLERVARNFDTLFALHCRDVPHGRVTREKVLQSFLISEAYRNDRRLTSINRASRRTDEPVDLTFVTDEIPLPTENGKIVCDILALRRDGGRSTPVLIELKDSRMLTRLVEQVESYSLLMEDNREGFEKLFEAVLGEAVRFDAFVETWIVWPRAGVGREPNEQALAEQGIRTVCYEAVGSAYGFDVGIDRPRCPSCGSTKAVVPIFRGEPTELAGRLASQGRAVLGGCLIGDDDRSWRCRTCKGDFGPRFLQGS